MKFSLKTTTLSSALLLSIASNSAQAAPTNGDDFLFFQGVVGQLTTTLVNAYSGESIAINGEYNINTGSYDGLDGVDALLMTGLSDYLAVESTVGVQLFANVEKVFGSTGNDIIDLSSSTIILNDVLISGSTGGDNILWGNAGNDMISGGEGNDIINGGPGNDIIEVTGIFGDDSLSDFSGFDEIFFSDSTITLSDLLVQSIGLDLLITEINGKGSLTIQNQFQGSGLLALDQLRFEDGSTFDLSSVSAVPVPAAVWLFGSGLLGLLGIARKKRTLG